MCTLEEYAGEKMEKLAYARDGDELSRAAIVKQWSIFELKKAASPGPPGPRRGENYRQDCPTCNNKKF